MFVAKMMPKLNLPEYPCRLREKQDGKAEIYDTIRKKFVRLTPEEWVRQHLLNFFINHLDFPGFTDTGGRFAEIQPPVETQ